MPIEPLSQLMLQIMGAIFIAFAMINYLSKIAIIGGIYNKAILMGNIAYHCISGIVFVKFIISHNLYGEVFIPLTAIYLLLGLGFLRLNFVSPKN